MREHSVRYHLHPLLDVFRPLGVPSARSIHYHQRVSSPTPDRLSQARVEEPFTKAVFELMAAGVVPHSDILL